MLQGLEKVGTSVLYVRGITLKGTTQILMNKYIFFPKNITSPYFLNTPRTFQQKQSPIYKLQTELATVKKLRIKQTIKNILNKTPL